MGGQYTAERFEDWAASKISKISKINGRGRETFDDADAEEGQEANEGQEKLIDCKVIARTLAKKDPMSISPRRGYVIVSGQGFAEHWWSVKGASEEIIDLTDVQHVFGVTPKYVPLDKENAPILLSTCDAVSGPCQDNPACAWCRTRLQIGAKGEKRLSRDSIKGMRLVLDHLTARNRVLRAALISTVVKDGVCLLCHVKVVGGVHGAQCVLKAEG